MLRPTFVFQIDCGAYPGISTTYLDVSLCRSASRIVLAVLGARHRWDPRALYHPLLV